MARFEISMTTNYVSDWGVWEGIREIVQNARDGEIEHGAKMSVDHTGKTLRLKNEGAVLPREALLIGFSTKARSRETIGQFGEGLKLGTLALIRTGCNVRIRNGEEIWTPLIVQSEKYNADVLAFDVTKSRARNPKRELSVEITGIELDQWEHLSKNFLFLQQEVECIETPRGKLIIDKELQGRLYVKGIFVEQTNLVYGYDFHNVEVDRDRRMVNGFDRKFEGANILTQAAIKDSAHREAVMDSIDAMFRQGKSEVEYVRCEGPNTKGKIQGYMLDKFRAEYGQDAIPVRSLDASRKLEYASKKGIVMPEAYVDMVEPLVGNIEELLAEAENEMIERVSWPDLTSAEKETFDLALRLAGRALEDFDTSVVDLVRFPAGQDRLGQYLDGRCLVDVKNLESVGQTVATIVHEWGHHLDMADSTVRHAGFVEKAMSEIIDNVLMAIPA